MDQNAESPSVNAIMDFFLETFDFFSDFYKRLGEIEKKHGFSFEMFQKDKSRDLLQKISPEMAPEKLGHFFKFLLLIAQMGYNFENVYAMSADQKIDIGNKLKDIVKDFKKSFSEKI